MREVENIISLDFTSLMEPSKSFSLNKTDVKKVGRLYLVALAGFTLTFIVNTLPQVDFGTYTPFIGVLATGLVELARRWIVDNS